MDSAFSGLLTTLSSQGAADDLIEKSGDSAANTNLLSNDLLENVEKSLTGSGGFGSDGSGEGMDRSNFDSNVVSVLKNGGLKDKKRFSLSQLFGQGGPGIDLSSNNANSASTTSNVSSNTNTAVSRSSGNLNSSQGRISSNTVSSSNLSSSSNNASGSGVNLSQRPLNTSNIVTNTQRTSFSSAPSTNSQNRLTTLSNANNQNRLTTQSNANSQNRFTTSSNTLQSSAPTTKFLSSSISNNSDTGASINGNLTFDVERDRNLDGTLGIRVATVRSNGGENPNNEEDDIASILSTDDSSQSTSGQSDLAAQLRSSLNNQQGANQNLNLGQLLSNSQSSTGNPRISVKITPVKASSNLSPESTQTNSDGKIITTKRIVTDLAGAKSLLSNLIPSGSQSASGGVGSSQTMSSGGNGIDLSQLIKSAGSQDGGGSSGGLQATQSGSITLDSGSVNQDLLKSLLASSNSNNSSTSTNSSISSNSSNTSSLGGNRSRQSQANAGSTFASQSSSFGSSLNSSRPQGTSFNSQSTGSPGSNEQGITTTTTTSTTSNSQDQISSSSLADLLKSSLGQSSGNPAGTVTTTKITISGPQNASSKEAALSLADLLKNSLDKQS